MCLIEDQSWIDCIDITSRWDTFVLYHLYGNKGVSLPLWPIRPRWFHTFCPCAEPLGDGYEGMWARFGSQGSIALNWHSRYSGTGYSGTWLYFEISVCLLACLPGVGGTLVGFGWGRSDPGSAPPVYSKCYKRPKRGIETKHFAKFWRIRGVEVWHFHIFSHIQGSNHTNFPRSKSGSKLPHITVTVI